MSQSISPGTVPYQAPEVISSNCYNTKVDVYAFGILMYEVISGKRAYNNILHGQNKLNMFQFQSKIVEGLRPKIEEGLMKKSFQNLIEKCWSKDPQKRPTFSELYEILSLSNVDVDVDDEFSLNDAVYDDVLEYVSMINDEPKLNIDKESNNDDKEELISKLLRDNEQLKSDNEVLKKDTFQLKKENIQILNRLDKIEKEL